MKSLELEAVKGAEDYVEQGWFKLEYSSFGNTAKEVKQSYHTGFLAGAAAALRLLSKKADESAREFFVAETLKGDLHIFRENHEGGGLTKFVEYQAIAPLRARVRVLEEKNAALEKRLAALLAQRDSLIDAEPEDFEASRKQLDSELTQCEEK
jgi:hypothetical protein